MPQLAALRQTIDAQLVLENADRDPHVFAIMLAMTSAGFYDRKPASPSLHFSCHGDRQSNHKPAAQFRDVKLQAVVHQGRGNAAISVVYTATVTLTFLTRFMLPHKAPTPQGRCMETSYTPVRVYPLLGLSQRLAMILTPSITADTTPNAPDHIGFWEPLVEQRPAEEDLPGRSVDAKRRKVARI
ncbi:hypothetical protein C7999DRAFT_32622 [Corynascus novoguineensis]|uniref:Uncharacterized protein n=1 Tax=Corynascus novoguineensis TaxID=1126955 RepID=A0AAN7CS44_9PEZI|nr:hypothetical protein C7999DRAFT_32622 [Corynascus novoguineensis]